MSVKHSFSDALESMKNGFRVQRSGWNGKGMFLFIIRGNDWEFTTDVDGADGLETAPFICMKTADNQLVPWLASQTDILSHDWQVIDD